MAAKSKVCDIKKIEDRIEFCSKSMHAQSMLYLRNDKDAIKAMDFLTLGDDQRKGEDPESSYAALVYYNMAACFACPNTAELAYAYSNRSTIYFRMAMYKSFLKDIERCKSNPKCPKRIFEIMDNQQKEYELVAQYKLAGNSTGSAVDQHVEDIILSSFKFRPQISYDANPHVPTVSSILKLHNTPKDGQHIITTRTLKPGQVVCIESPITSIVSNSCAFTNCANCLKDNYLSLIPCTKCTKTMFCSVNCATEANKSYHQFECPIIDFLQNSGKIIQITFRILILMLRCFQQNLSDLHEFWIENDNIKTNIFEPLDSTKFTKYQQQFLQLMSLSPNYNYRNENIKTIKGLGLLYLQIINNTKIGLSCETDSDKEILLKLLYRSKLIAQTSADTNDIGSRIFLVNRILNHSCEPNIIKTFCGNKMYMQVIRPMKRGDQLRISYDGLVLYIILLFINYIN